MNGGLPAGKNEDMITRFDTIHQRDSGVVQGSCLGPLLFLVYINDVLDIFKSPVNCKLYADDIKLLPELKTAADESCFQGCLDLLYSWSVIWQLAI